MRNLMGMSDESLREDKKTEGSFTSPPREYQPSSVLALQTIHQRSFEQLNFSWLNFQLLYFKNYPTSNDRTSKTTQLPMTELETGLNFENYIFKVYLARVEGGTTLDLPLPQLNN